jgi:hypothetical protein
VRARVRDVPHPHILFLMPEVFTYDVMSGVETSKMADLFMCGCCLSDSDKQQLYRSREIDKDISKERLQFRRTVRILLLGAGESGKSTFLKQMKIIHGQEFSDRAMQEYKTIVFNNIVKGMRVLIDARRKLLIPWEDERLETHANFVFAYDGTVTLDSKVFSQYIQPCKSLWGDSAIRAAFDRRREFQLVCTLCIICIVDVMFLLLM